LVLNLTLDIYKFVLSCHFTGKPVELRSELLHPRVVMLTDGHVTDDHTFKGQDFEKNKINVSVNTCSIDLTLIT